MTVTEIIQQVKNLEPNEQDELLQRLLEMRSEGEAVRGQTRPMWSDAELAELLTIEPLTGKEIIEAGLTGSWSDLGIKDGADWVETQRRIRRERRKW